MAARGAFASPTGTRADGSDCFTESDLVTSGGVSLSRMPAGDIVLELVPSAPKNSTDTYTGANTPIKCSLDDNCRRVFRCMHEMVKADKKKGTPSKLCTSTWNASTKTTVGSMRSHCRGGHWLLTGVEHVQVAGQKKLSFAPPKKRQREADTASPDKQVRGEGTAATGIALHGKMEDSAGTTTAGGEDVAAMEVEGANDAHDESGVSASKTADDDAVDMEVCGGTGEDAGSLVEVGVEYIACLGINYADFSQIDYPKGFDFTKDYPLAIHSQSTQLNYGGSNLIPNVSWTVDSNGKIKAGTCESIIIRGRKDMVAVAATTTKAGAPACRQCVSLQYNQPLLRVLGVAAKKEYGRLPNVLCPQRVVAKRITSMSEQLNGLRLQQCNDKRKISALTRRVDDRTRLVLLLQEMDVPAIKCLAMAHFQNGGSLSAFIEKCHRAADSKMVGHATLQRAYVQRGAIRNGVLDPETYKVLCLTILMNKIGCSKLVHTYHFVKGGMSQRQMTRHVNEYRTVPNFKLALTVSINDQGLGVIEKNMVALFLNEQFVSFLPKHKCVVHLLIDGVAVDERLGLDDSQLPHQVTGGCRHWGDDATFNSYADALRIQEGLENGTFHLAKEAEMLCLGINDGEFTSLIPLAISPTCKKDDIVEESTSTIRDLVSTILEMWNKLPVSNQLLFSSVHSDGAPQFRKGVGQVLNKDLPPNMCRVYIADDGTPQCPLLNLVAGSTGTTASCDNDHLGKRFRARIKSDCGIAVGATNFTKTDLSFLLGQVRIVETPEEAHRLFFPEDLMDVLETVKCLDKVGKLATVPFIEFPAEWRAVSENKQQFREMRLLGAVSKLMCTSIVGHVGHVEEEGDHLSVSGYLTVLSELAHMLFFLFRQHKTDFIPAQNYRNWQEMIKNMFMSVTMAKVNGVEDFYWFLNTNKKIEEYFGIMRSMQGGDLNFDCLGLRNRAADASLVQWIYAQYPEWDTMSRRLKSSADRKNTRSWKGCTKVANVNEVECWSKGRDKALEALRASRVFTNDELDINAIIAAEPGVDMFRPYCRRVGVLAGDRAEYSLADLEADGDDEYEEDE